jgi:hypothetical protein
MTPVLPLNACVRAVSYDMNTTVLWPLTVIVVTFQLLWLEIERGGGNTSTEC